MTHIANDPAWPDHTPTALLVLADGTVLEGFGLGAEGQAAGEVCFNTAMTGYQEILTDPSYAGQIITFTFPHIGNVGTNDEDIETVNMAGTPGARGVILRSPISDPSNYRASSHLDAWLKARGIIGLSGIDTRALTALIRARGMPNAVIAHAADGVFDIADLKAKARAFPGLEGMDLVPMVSSRERYEWDATPWRWNEGFGRQDNAEFRVVAMDFGVKRNILRLLAKTGSAVTVVPATTSAEDILAMKPDGIFLSNGPGDPAATGEYAVPVIQKLIQSGTPIFGICLGHQILALALGARTVKMHQGHHGANHPVRDQTTGKVEITSMNHGFAVDTTTLPKGTTETHVSLFDGSNCGIKLDGKPVFSVQYHPEASPGPQDSHYLFERFAALMRERKQG
ncbi:MAG: glutamine-hydrolyzing carbamoyl-phosphate synthase small subunit [Alphaproteobacteria bacterium]|nr:glutamine-hydrolyzing carbamoyl-phosphate synthase small subunit [Alphaproteobacteria bacterium]